MSFGSIIRNRPASDLWLNRTGVGESAWTFKNIFTVTEEELAAPNVDLVFEGIDTFAVITLVSFTT